MGGIADYSGSLVLQMPLREATLVAVQRDPDLSGPRAQITIRSPREPGTRRTERVTLSREHILPGDGDIDYADARARLAAALEAQGDARWAAYVAGVWPILRGELGSELPGGARIEIRSSVPEGKGVSSSAALEVATMRAVCAAWSIELSGDRMALLCQKVENAIVGAPCGVMDQMTSAIGRSDRLLALLCRPAQVDGHLEIPAPIAFAGIDSGVRHAVTGADYATVRAAAFMARRILASHRPVEWLTELSPPEAVDDLPIWLSGDEFLGLYGSHEDAATEVLPHTSYPVRAAARHAVLEHRRVQRFAGLLAEPIGETEIAELGALMRESHLSYSACGLGTPETDRLVELAVEEGLPGGRITGGGSGGTVAVVGERLQLETSIRRIGARFAEETGITPHLFVGSSPGAFEADPWSSSGA